MNNDTAKPSSRFYVNEALNECEDVQRENFQPKMHSGEIEAARAQNVSLYISQHTKRLTKRNYQKEDELGLLLITNFRLSFTTLADNNKTTYQENAFLGQYDITLSNIDKIYQITDKKSKPIHPNVKNSSRIEAIRIICKNFRVITFGFQSSDVGRGKYIADALIKFAFPARHSLLFLYNYKEKYYNTSRSVKMYNQKEDWIYELERCNANFGWRVYSREKFDLPSDSLPLHYVIPKGLNDMDYFKYSKFFKNNRSAIWVWGMKNASLVRIAELNDMTNSKEENSVFEHVRLSDSLRKQLHIMELTKFLPSIMDVETSYLKLRELCTPENDRQFMEQDAKFHNLLDKTYWLMYVSLCLKYSHEASLKLRAGETVVLQEINSRDMCCVISSLVQLLLDPHWRTIIGFQNLIQKEWVSLGHPFCDRIGHVVNETTERGPLFLLFLDCCWQLLQQFPEEFEFCETFLTTIWDTVFIPVFDTFQFNSENDRYQAMRNDKLILRPVWDWGEQFHDKDIALFSNPLYKKPIVTESEMAFNRRSKLPPTAVQLPCLADLKLINAKNSLKSNRVSTKITIPLAPPQFAIQEQPNITADRFLEPQYAIRDLEIWQQCFYRWIPLLEIKNGGAIQIDLHNRLVVNNIHKLQKSLETGGANLSSSNDNILNTSASSTGNNDENGYYENLPTINSFFPYSSYENSTELTDILVLNGELLAEGSVFEFQDE